MDGDNIAHRLGQHGRQVSAELYRFWHWWREQLLGMLPATWQRRLRQPGQMLCIHPAHHGYRLEQQPGNQVHSPKDLPPEALQRLVRNAGQIRLYLPQDELLLTRVTLPVATAGNLEAVLRFEMDRHTPFTADQVYFGFHARPREATSVQIQVDLLLAPKAKTDAHLAELAELSIFPALLCAADQPKAPAIKLPVHPNDTSPRAGRRKSRKVILGLVMVLLLIALPLYHRQARIDTLTAELELPRQHAEQAAAFKRELTALQDSRTWLGQRRAERRATLLLLDELTRQLPDHTWLTRLELKEDSLQIRGESTRASELIGLLEGSSLFFDVRFGSPITINPATSRDRFMITARLVQGAAP
ncbi:PilN domain-containing protein [Oceanimonas doudoroffii]|uniref:PilN domain-containing protein n=1 Tax=Oceanimonas doudoroffii TaxID=84158 RepID=UPI001FECCA12|nr:PilN domain-containing protein [Oceanimonas doudoroffii]